MDAGLDQIPARAFYGCSSLKKIVVGDYVQTIGNQAFLGAGGGELVLGNSLTSIATATFRDNATTEDISCYMDPYGLTWDDAGWTFKPDGSTRVHVYAYDLDAWRERHPAANVTFVGDLEIQS